MKLLLTIICASALSITMATAQNSTNTTTSAAQTTTTTTESVGTISDFTAGSTIVLNTGSGEPVHYKLGKSVTYVNAKGKVITAERMKKDKKVRVHYVKDGNDMVVDKVTVIKNKE